MYVPWRFQYSRYNSTRTVHLYRARERREITSLHVYRKTILTDMFTMTVSLSPFPLSTPALSLEYHRLRATPSHTLLGTPSWYTQLIYITHFLPYLGSISPDIVLLFSREYHECWPRPTLTLLTGGSLMQTFLAAGGVDCTGELTVLE